MSIKPKPEGYNTLTSFHVLDDIPQMIEFLEKAFDAEVTEKIQRPDGELMHVEMQIGDSKVMLGANRAGGELTRSLTYVYVNDTDATYSKALAAGATSIMEPSDQFYGDRNAGVSDPTGNQWWIATHIEDVSEEEMNRRAAEMG